MTNRRFPLLARILLAIALGVVLGMLLPEPVTRLFATFNAIFSQFLGFIIPLIIAGLAAPAIADIGSRAGKLLLTTVAIAYLDTILAALIAYFTGSMLFPSLLDSIASSGIDTSGAAVVEPYFTITIPPLLDVMSALVAAFIIGLGVAYMGLPTLRSTLTEFRQIIVKTIERAIVPLLPLYIFGIFLLMTTTGQAGHILSVFAMVIVVIFTLHIFILFYSFSAAGIITRRNPWKLFVRMLPAYFTALGTSSSAATIPVTLQQSVRNGVNGSIAGFTVPLCATIHMPGSAMKVTACALTICLLNGMPHHFGLFLHFILFVGIIMVAAPGVPGGAIMAALAPLASILGFSTEDQALIIALYIAMDSFGTACNVTGDGAVALIVDKLLRHGNTGTGEASPVNAAIGSECQTGSE